MRRLLVAVLLTFGKELRILVGRLWVELPVLVVLSWTSDIVVIVVFVDVLRILLHNKPKLCCFVWDVVPRQHHLL